MTIKYQRSIISQPLYILCNCQYQLCDTAWCKLGLRIAGTFFLHIYPKNIQIILYLLVAVTSSEISKVKQKLSVTFNSDKVGGIDFTKFSKLMQFRCWPVLAGTMAWASSQALHMVSFEIFVKAMPPSLSELKVLPTQFLLRFQNP